MEIKKEIIKNSEVAIVNSDKLLITDVQSALDLMMTVKYETGCKKIIINKEAITEDFFILSTRLAGEILQKFMNYEIKFAVYGDFSKYSSKSLNDFIYESNNGKDFYFVQNLKSAIDKIAQ